jgi:hypothetical protein
MNDVINEYQKWKQQGEDLRVKAKLAMETRFRELLLEAVEVAEEYKKDFGGVLKPPPAVTSFRHKAGGAKKKKPAPKSAPVAPVAAPAKPSRKVLGLQKQLATAKSKLEAAKAAGAPTRNLDDRIYEIEDALKASGN